MDEINKKVKHYLRWILTISTSNFKLDDIIYNRPSFLSKAYRFLIHHDIFNQSYKDRAQTELIKGAKPFCQYASYFMHERVLKLEPPIDPRHAISLIISISLASARIWTCVRAQHGYVLVIRDKLEELQFLSIRIQYRTIIMHDSSELTGGKCIVGYRILCSVHMKSRNLKLV